MNHMKRMWGHYLVLVIIIATLVCPVSWIQKTIQNLYGVDESYLALTAISMAIIFLGIWGGTHANRLHRFLHDEAARKAQMEDARGKPVVLEVLGVELFRSEVQPEINKATQVETKPVIETTREDIQYPSSFQPRKRRGKQSRFPKEKICNAVWRWEKRGPSFSARTLEEFLEEEFGSGPDGILLVAASTFYDWRRNILNEIEEQCDHP